MSRPNADELMGFALEASTYFEAIPGWVSQMEGDAMSRARLADVGMQKALIELGKGDSKVARPWLLRAMYMIGAALLSDKVTTPEEPREERRYTRAEVDELLWKMKANIGTMGEIYHATRNESDANLRRAIAAEAEVTEMRGQIERLLKKGGA
jgi:hypothetical protein